MLAAALNSDLGMLVLGDRARRPQPAPELEFELRLLRENLVNRVARPVLESARRSQAEKRLAIGLSDFQRTLAALPLRQIVREGRAMDAETMMGLAHAALDLIDRVIDESELSPKNFIALSTYVQLSRAQVRLTDAIHRAQPSGRLNEHAAAAMSDALAVKVAAEIVFGICAVGATKEIPPRSATVFSELCATAEELAKIHHERFLHFFSLVMPDEPAASPRGRRVKPQLPQWVATAHELGVERAKERLRALRA